MDALRIGSMSGFYGDRFSAMREMLLGGDLDVLTGDYLAELTMLILGRSRVKDPNLGYAKTFLRQMEENLALIAEKKVRVVTNAGGLNPAGLANALRKLAGELKVDLNIAHVEGDDLLARAGELGFGEPLTANAYLGAWGIVACLNAGADVVVTGRVTDASLIVGPAAAHFGWRRDDWDALAGAVVAGHIIECGTQVTGGNYAFFTEHNLGNPGFPIAEVHADGSCVITKHAGTGGVVNTGTVTAQLLYEITGPRYLGPDVTTRFDTVTISEQAPNRVRVVGARGEPPPSTLKVCLNAIGGFRNEMTFVLTGLDIETKAAWVRTQLEEALADNRPAEVRWTLARTDHENAATEEQASALLHCVAKDSDPRLVGRKFSNTAIELTLASYPGFHVTTPPTDAAPYGVYTAAFVDANNVPHRAVFADGSTADIPPAGRTQPLSDVDPVLLPEKLADGPTKMVPLGSVFGARSGDKGGSANVGVWARSTEAWQWLAHELTVDKFRQLLPETETLLVHRYLFPNLWAVNFVIDGILGQGVAAKARFDPQAKALGEWLRSRKVELPVSLLDTHVSVNS